MIKKIGIIMNGVTGRMGYRQHLVRSVLAIRDVDSSTNTPGTIGPLQVTTLERFGIGTQPTRLVLTFTGPLNPATATNLAN